MKGFKSILFPKHILFITIYLITNSFFVLRYGIRQDYLHISTLLLLYNGLFFLGAYLIGRYRLTINKFKYFNSTYVVFYVLVFVFFCGVNIYIEGDSLNVDRWSALQVTVDNLLKGNYPYAVKDHLGQTTSNLPGLFYFGLPFYCLGNISLLQPFVFLVLFTYIFRLKIENYQKVFMLFLVISAPAYWWELIVKSDLMSNVIIASIFINYWSQKKQWFNQYVLLAFICALLSLTRGVVIVPLTLFLFAEFWKLQNSIQLKFAFSFFIGIVLVSLPVLITLPDIPFLIEHNPFNHQTRYAPKILIIISLILPFMLSFKVQKRSDIMQFSFFILGGLIWITFLLNCIEEGFFTNIYGAVFDLSYLSMVLPFLLFYAIQQCRLSSE